MLNIAAPEASRALRKEEIDVDLAVVGAGLAGVCAAITAARLGLRVALVHDRPVPGGNASSEVRLWVQGATSHMVSNNRWAREGGVIDEILVENLWRNREGNPVLFDALLLEKLAKEPGILLLLNTACHAAEMSAAEPGKIAAIGAFCAQNSTDYRVRAPLFLDSSGDGVLGFLAGAVFRMGAEPREEFDEAFARDGDFGHLLGHSIYFQTRDTGRPVTFVAPSFALRDVPGRIPRHRSFSLAEQGCRLWWIEWGGRLDTIHETEAIKWELWRIVYGVWDHIKNSGDFPEATNHALDWVGLIPGKRESRRFEGDHILRQGDIVGRVAHADTVAHGGWSIDLHPADGVYAKIAGSHHLHAKGVYGIPWRCYHSRNVRNLFLGGRIISCSHVAFGSTRVMGTCAAGGQAVGVAAAQCLREGVEPRALGERERMARLQLGLQRLGQHLPGIVADDPDDLSAQASASASSERLLAGFGADAPPVALDRARAQLLPLPAGDTPEFTVVLDVERETTLQAELWTTSDARHHTPDLLLGSLETPVRAGARREIALRFDARLAEPRYVFLILRPAAGVAWHTSAERLTGVLALRRQGVEDFRAVGGEAFEMFTPERRPGGRNFAMKINPPAAVFPAEAVKTPVHRPTHQANAWVAAPDDLEPTLCLRWREARTIAQVLLCFDNDADHAMDSVLFGHPECAVPFCVRDFDLLDEDGAILREVRDNHHGRVVVTLAPQVTTRRLVLRVRATHGAPAAVFGMRVYDRPLLPSRG